MKSMTNEAFIDYCMEMHCLSPEQKLLYLKELVDSMQENYEKPRFIVTSGEELYQKLEEGYQSVEKYQAEELLIESQKDKRIEHYDYETQKQIICLRLNYESRKTKLLKLFGDNDEFYAIKEVQLRIDKLPKFKDKKLEELISIFDVDDASKFLKKSHQETADDFFKCIGYVKDVSYKEKYEIAVVGNIVIIKFWFKRKKKKEHHYHYAVCHSHFSTSW